jgi:hypothetical protein
MPPKTPIWKSIGRSRNRSKAASLASEKKRENRGNNMARESNVLTLKEERKEGSELVEEMIILIAGEGDQRSFKLSSCGAKILTGDNRFQKWAAHGGRIVNPLVCLSFPFFLILLTCPHLPTSARFPLILSPLFLSSSASPLSVSLPPFFLSRF